MKRKLLIITIVLACSLSGCGKNVKVGKGITTETAQEETVNKKNVVTESINSSELATELTTDNTVGAEDLENYIGWWVYYYTDSEWLDIALNHVDSQGKQDKDKLYVTVIDYSSKGDGYYLTHCERLPLDEKNTVVGVDSFSYTFTPAGDHLKITIGYPKGAEFEGEQDMKYILKKEDDINLQSMERNIQFKYDSKQEKEAATSAQNNENQISANKSKESTSKYADSDLINAAEGFLDTAIANSAKRNHSSYSVDSVTSVTRNSDDSNYYVKFLILFDGHTKEYLTVRMMDTMNGLKYSGVN